MSRIFSLAALAANLLSGPVYADEVSLPKFQYADQRCHRPVANNVVCMATIEAQTFAEFAGATPFDQFLVENSLPADTDPNAQVPTFTFYVMRVRNRVSP